MDHVVTPVYFKPQRISVYKRFFVNLTSSSVVASSMKDVFKIVNTQSFIDFIKEIQFYHEL